MDAVRIQSSKIRGVNDKRIVTVQRIDDHLFNCHGGQSNVIAKHRNEIDRLA